MTEYRYKAVNTAGLIHQGRLAAANEFELEMNLQQQGLTLISSKAAQQRRWPARRIPRREMINFLVNLQQLAQSGVPLIDGLTDIRDSTAHHGFKDILSQAIDQVQAGKLLSAALAEHPHIFNELFIALIRVGEQTGHISDTLADLADSMKWTDELMSRARKIITYPSVVGLVVFGVVCFLMIHLVPQLIPFIRDMGGDLPAHTRALILLSEWIRHYWLALLLSPLLFCSALWLGARHSPALALYLDHMKLRIPLVGDLLFKIKVARFCNYFALMYRAGISVIDALESSKALLDNHYLRQALNTIRQQISDGQTITHSFAQANIFPPLVIRMLKVGEQTGDLDTALINVKYFFDRDVNEAIAKVEPLIEPILTLTLGGVLLWVMVSVLGPIYDIITQL